MKKCRQTAVIFLLCLLCLSTFSVYADGNEYAEWLDEEGFLREEFFADKSDAALSEQKIDGLVRTLSEKELEAYVSNLNAGISALTVTNYQKVSQVNPDTGRTLYTGLFEVDGILAFCIERSATTPARNSPTGPWQAVTNDNLRKVLYYGYNGPQAQGYTYVETALAAGEANGDGDNSLGRKVLAAIQTYASPPSNFKVWKVETNGGRTQDLAFYTIEANGYIQVQKISANPALTKGNACYSFLSAGYGVYSDAACTNELGRMYADDSGFTNAVLLSPGVYYVRELVSPRGYLISSEVRAITIRPSETTLAVFANEPKLVVPQKLIQKLDAQTGEAVPQGKGSLSGAEFRVSYYPGDYAEGIDPKQTGASPMKEWILHTDTTGAVYLDSAHLKSGSPFWTNAGGEAFLPHGTLTIQEIKASDGYRMNQEIYIQKIAGNGNVFETILVSEPIIELELTKYREASKLVLPGARFAHESPDGSVEETVTDSGGKISWKGLQTGQHRIWEVEAAEGYLHNQNVLVFEVSVDGEITVLSQADASYGVIRTSIGEAGKFVIEVENKLGKKLPETGRSAALAVTVTGTVFCLLGIRKRKIGGKKNEK